MTRRCPRPTGSGDALTFFISSKPSSPVTWLSRQLRHSSLKVTTDVYGHWERDVAKREAAKMEGVFGV
jgi:integrase